MKYYKLILTSTIAITALFGDYIVFQSKVSQFPVLKAVTDTLIHGAIGGLTAITFFSHEPGVSEDSLIFNVAICTLISSFIDVDHIFVAKSFYIKDLTGQNQRGLFHCTTFWLLITTPIFIYSVIVKRINVQLLNWMAVLAFLSHHLRDGNRRGLWMYPWGSTRPISKYVYVGLSAILPHVLGYAYKFIKPSHSYSLLSDIEIV